MADPIKPTKVSLCRHRAFVGPHVRMRLSALPRRSARTHSSSLDRGTVIRSDASIRTARCPGAVRDTRASADGTSLLGRRAAPEDLQLGVAMARDAVEEG